MPQKKGSRNSLYLVSNQSSGVTARKVTGVLMLNKKSVRYCSLRGLISRPLRNLPQLSLEPSPSNLSRTFPPNLCWNFLRAFTGTFPKSAACVYPMFILICGYLWLFCEPEPKSWKVACDQLWLLELRHKGPLKCFKTQARERVEIFE